MSKVIDTVEAKLAPVISELGYELVDVEYKKNGADMCLTIYIDISSGISLDDCEKVHNIINPILDELDPTEDLPYILNVSSPGLDRPFKKQRDYERNYGKEVEIKLYAPLKGKKLYEGILTHKYEHVVEFKVKDEIISIELSKIVYVRPLVKFN